MGNTAPQGGVGSNLLWGLGEGNVRKWQILNLRRLPAAISEGFGAILALTEDIALPANSRNTRALLIVALLLVSLVTAGLLAAQAYVAGRYRLAAAESVLRDYATFVADEAIRRSTADVGYYGYYVLVTALLREAQSGPHLPPGIAARLASSEDQGIRKATSLATAYFEVVPASGNVLFASGAVPAAIVDQLQQKLAAAPPSKGQGPYVGLNFVHEGRVFSFVAASASTPAGKEIVAGFQIDPDGLARWMKIVLERRPLLPPSLGHGKVTNSFVHLTVRNPVGALFVRLGSETGPDGLSASKPFGDDYQGIFSGYTVTAAIDPQAANAVIIGGLPRSRLPFFLGLLALNVALIVTAILQLRREMALQRLRDEFVASVSHELRTPLTQIRMFTETLLLDRIRSNDEQRRSLEIIDREARRLGQLVENVLQFSRSERKIASLAKSRQELAPLLSEIVDDFESSMNGTPVHIEPRLASGVSAEVDCDAIRQIVLNLLDNAVKYGPKHQLIVLGLEVQDSKAVLFVEDEGPGIPEGERERVFERFQRLERDCQSATAGTGIGLSVVRDLVLRHGGRCHVANGKRTGARLVVELPLAPPPEGATT
jgi:signal transduction histidine kinase